MLSMCVMDIMNVLRTGMNMSISHIHVWLCNMKYNQQFALSPVIWVYLSLSCCYAYPESNISVILAHVTIKQQSTYFLQSYYLTHVVYFSPVESGCLGCNFASKDGYHLSICDSHHIYLVSLKSYETDVTNNLFQINDVISLFKFNTRFPSSMHCWKDYSWVPLSSIVSTLLMASTPPRRIFLIFLS